MYSSTLRDVFVRLAIEGIVRPHWSDKILDETFASLAANRPDLGPERLRRTRELMGRAVPDALVEGFEYLTGGICLPDAEDRHVLAAAVAIGARFIVTMNLKDFPPDYLFEWGVVAIHPDDFLLSVSQANSVTFRRILRAISQAWRAPGATMIDVLESLAVDAPRTAQSVRDDIEAPGH